MTQKRSPRWTRRGSLGTIASWLAGLVLIHMWLQLGDTLTSKWNEGGILFVAITASIAISLMLIPSILLKKVLVVWAIAGVLWPLEDAWGILLSLPLSLLLLTYLPAFHTVSPTLEPMKKSEPGAPTSKPKTKQKSEAKPRVEPKHETTTKIKRKTTKKLSTTKLKKLLEAGDYHEAVEIFQGATRKDWIKAIAKKKGEHPELYDLWTLAGQDTMNLKRYDEVIQTRNKLFSQLRRQYGSPVFEVDGLSQSKIWSQTRKCLSKDSSQDRKTSQMIIDDAKRLVDLNVPRVDIYSWQVISGEATFTDVAKNKEIAFDIPRDIKPGQIIKARRENYLVRIKSIG